MIITYPPCWKETMTPGKEFIFHPSAECNVSGTARLVNAIEVVSEEP